MGEEFLRSAHVYTELFEPPFIGIVLINALASFFRKSFLQERISPDEKCE